jgi:hypothetical protein
MLEEIRECLRLTFKELVDRGLLSGQDYLPPS